MGRRREGRSAAPGSPQVDESFRVIDHVRWPWLLWGTLAFAVAIVAAPAGWGCAPWPGWRSPSSSCDGSSSPNSWPGSRPWRWPWPAAP